MIDVFSKGTISSDKIMSTSEIWNIAQKISGMDLNTSLLRNNSID